MDFLQDELIKLKHDSLLRELKLVQGPQEAKITIDGRFFINLSSNNYLGLCNDARLKNHAIEAINKYGLGVGASRLVCGSMMLHNELEKRIASFKGFESALVFNSGYSANLSLIPALAGRDDVVFSDRLNHASIIDAVILSRAKLWRYPHVDMQALESFLKRAKRFRRRIIATDSVFSMDGDLAPLDKIVDLAERYDAYVFIDEAHATGVIGKSGRGAIEHFVIDSRRLIEMGTLSKALGSFGAYICGSSSLIDYLVNKARGFIYTTALPVSLCAASLAALDIVENDAYSLNQLRDNIVFFRQSLRSRGVKISDDLTPIIPLLVGDAKKALEFSERLFEQGIFVQAIRPPTVPEGTSRLRITLTAAHTKRDLKFCLDKILTTAKKFGIITSV
ncbi:MAG: 8-amino-7-oxononanoate synthase [Candidatus Omnitrophica bacterium CG11_big_fil_rev_8_21_14_0_20_42_13]|uniref:8-amino-7-ketopelargonate synthase n=1 Tax=Candidatus Ghiorseimicrobium undicola TaxID=1974746 RepID=A0A2H0LV98_9BACT|nr:MAG: 8-amino-7-oxononanoate synthase [Candidatus Omnitrophica bacterium CG11_big_fil_rev_8_21_14_0_20_42_13]